MYETPDMLELGDISETTLGRPWGDWDDGLPHRYIFIPHEMNQD